jgi:hypothetical protein
MRFPMRWRAVLAAVGVLSLLAAAVSAAAVPKFKPKTIVTGKAIGGVKVGMTKHDAIALWGKPDRHDSSAQTATAYQYVAKSTLADGTVTPPQQYATFWVRSGKVIEIEIETAENTKVDPKLHKLKTSKGIKLDSTMDQAQAAYGFPEPAGGEAGLSRGVYKQGKHCTLFYAPEQPYSDIRGISVGLCNSNVGGLVGLS